MKFNKSMSFDEKLEFFSTGRVSAVPFYPRPFELRWMPRVGGQNVRLHRNGENHTKEDALTEARAYKDRCKSYPRQPTPSE